MPRLICVSRGCSYLVHTNVKNNDGMHCCAACKKNAGKHGVLCEKTVVPTYVLPPK